MDETIRAEDIPPEIFARILQWFSGDVMQFGIIQSTCHTWREYTLSYAQFLNFRNLPKNASAPKVISNIERYAKAVANLNDSSYGIRRLDLYKLDMISPSGFETILNMCGSTLRSLSLSCAERVNSTVIKSVATHCGSSLTRLDLTGCRKLTPDSFEPLFENRDLCNSLQSLTLKGLYRCETDDFGRRISESFPNLTHLDLRGFAQSSKDFLLCIAERLNQLKHLEIQQSIKLLDRDVVAALLKNCKNLEFLNAKQCNGQWPSLPVAPIVGEYPISSSSLRVLELQHFNILHDEDLRAICLMAPGISEISISDCLQLTDAGVQSLATLNSLRRIECKNLVNVTDSPLIDVVESCHELEILNVEGCSKLTDDLTKAICEAPRQSCKKKITINYSQCSLITDKSILMIAESCTGIRNMGLISCQLITTGAVLQLLDRRRATLMNVGVLDCPLVDSMQVITQLPKVVPYLNKMSINPPMDQLESPAVKSLYEKGTITFGAHYETKSTKEPKDS